MPTPAPDRSGRNEYRKSIEHRIAPQGALEMREVPNGTGGSTLRLSAFASVTGDDASYEMEDWLGPWVESISRGAFKKTLAETPDVVFRLNHDGLPLGRTAAGTLKLAEVIDPNASPVFGVTGLHYEVLLDPRNSLVEQMRSAIERGDLSQSSFMFRVIKERWDERTWERRWIDEVSLDRGDVSICTFGANPNTDGTVSLRQRFDRYGRGRRADSKPSCNRCNGDGSIVLNGKSTTCPQCKGTGGPEGNAAETLGLRSLLSATRRAIARSRIEIERTKL